tara:strand:+ start:844 stop:1554 length:711 start_codon:yes stop_codon:yes gene_type:complete
MKISFISPFCNLLENFTSISILNRAQEKGIVEYDFFDLFSFSNDPNNKIDDHPYGGGDGMILKAQPIYSAYNEVINNMSSKFRVIYPTPDGQMLSTKIAKKLANEDNLIFICGHYKGVDQRIRDDIVTDEISIGDYILTGGELPACVIADSIIRLVPGVLNSIESAKTDSFYDGLLDSPHYTRPEKYNGLRVPDILMSGNHKKIKEWKDNKREEKTKLKRPDLYDKYIKGKNQKVD